MAFNENAFMLAGTSIAIFGVALYIWDTRKDSVTSSFNQAVAPMSGGSRSNRRKNSHKKTKRR